MRKLLITALTIVAATTVAGTVRAESGSGLEISGNVTTLSGWQKTTKAAANASAGILSDFGVAPAGAQGVNQFGFYVDQVELDLAKSFGENIRARADLDFSAHRAAGGTGIIEQAYVTANIPAGNGAELLVGRFNSGIGLDPIDRNELSTVSFSAVHRTLLPHNLTGARLGYNFSETTRGELFIVNSLRDAAPVAGTDTVIPGFGMNLVYSFGEEGNQSWVKLNVAGSPETASRKPWSILGDLSGSVSVNEAFKVGLEGVYRQDGNIPGNDSRYFGGQIKGTYAFSDVWDGTLRYSIVHSRQAAGAAGTANPDFATIGFGATGGTTHQISLATGYSIADGARFILEGNLDLTKARGAGTSTSYVPGVAGMFAYSF